MHRPCVPDGLRRCGAVIGLVALAGCVTTPPVRVPLTPAGQAAVLAALPGFGIDGRAGVVAGSNGFNASFSWRQAGELGNVRLSGPFGAGSLSVEYSPQRLRVVTSRGDTLHDDAAAALITQELGFLPPFEALRYWVLGLPAPGEAAGEESFDAAGRITERRQHGWHIRYELWMDHAVEAGTLHLPQRLTATRDALRLRVFADRWMLD